MTPVEEARHLADLRAALADMAAAKDRVHECAATAIKAGVAPGDVALEVVRSHTGLPSTLIIDVRE